MLAGPPCATRAGGTELEKLRSFTEGEGFVDEKTLEDAVAVFVAGVEENEPKGLEPTAPEAPSFGDPKRLLGCCFENAANGFSFFCEGLSPNKPTGFCPVPDKDGNAEPKADAVGFGCCPTTGVGAFLDIGG